mmetsp:Transcript_29360/g.46908  ORF Transcript_29360/g.46908 Transcript_29360/m.46908 type:complete len:369 (+) Transcript_29360:64-1170(+)
MGVASNLLYDASGSDVESTACPERLWSTASPAFHCMSILGLRSSGHTSPSTFTSFVECSHGPVPNPDVLGPEKGNFKAADAMCNEEDYCVDAKGEKCIAKSCLEADDILNKEVQKLSQQQLKIVGTGSVDEKASNQLETRAAKFMGVPFANDADQIQGVIARLKSQIKQNVVPETATTVQPGVENVLRLAGEGGLYDDMKNLTAAQRGLDESVTNQLPRDRISLMTTQDIPGVLKDVVTHMNETDRPLKSVELSLAKLIAVINASVGPKAGPPSASRIDAREKLEEQLQDAVNRARGIAPPVQNPQRSELAMLAADLRPKSSLSGFDDLSSATALSTSLGLAVAYPKDHYRPYACRQRSHRSDVADFL